MSICPERDIHSLYVDGELNSPYKEQYLSHIATCSKCKAELDKMMKLHTMFEKDINNIVFNNERMEKSYDKLSTLLRFRTITKKTDNNYSLFRYMPALAATAAILFAIIPLSLVKSTGNQNLATLSSQVTIIPKMLGETGITADENLATEVFSPSIAESSSSTIHDIFVPQLSKRDNLQNVSINTKPQVLSLDHPFEFYQTNGNIYSVNNTAISGLVY